MKLTAISKLPLGQALSGCDSNNFLYGPVKWRFYAVSFATLYDLANICFSAENAGIITDHKSAVTQPIMV